MKREKEKYRSFGLVAYGWRRVSMSQGKLSAVSPLSTAFPPCGCHPHTLLWWLLGNRWLSQPVRKLHAPFPLISWEQGPK